MSRRDVTYPLERGRGAGDLYKREVDAENRKAIRAAEGIPKLIQCLDINNHQLYPSAAIS